MKATGKSSMDAEQAKNLEAARGGNQEAFERLEEPYHHELVVHCYRILGSYEDAEDMLQETLMRAWQHIDSFEGRSTFRAWLYKIATNACLDTLDSRKRRGLSKELYARGDPAAPLPPPSKEIVWVEPAVQDSPPLGAVRVSVESTVKSASPVSVTAA